VNTVEPKIEINVIGVDDPLIRRRLKRISKPDLGVGNIRKCLLCGVETSWTVNSQPVCPLCQGKYGFVKKDWLPDPCEVCGEQGEWVCGSNDEHSLCHRHRDAWFQWTRQPNLFPGRDKMSDAEWHEAWERVWSRFVREMKKSIVE